MPPEVSPPRPRSRRTVRVRPATRRGSPTAPRICSQPSPWRSMWRCSRSTRVRVGDSSVNRTSTSLVRSGSVSTCQSREMSQLNTNRRGRLVGQDTRPPALAPVHAPVDDGPADPGLEHHLGQLGPEDVVLGRPPGADVVGEHGERPVDRRVDLDRLPYRRGDGGVDMGGPSCGLDDCLKDASAWPRTGPGTPRRAPTPAGIQRVQAAVAARRVIETRPAARSTFRCWDTAGRLTGTNRANSPTGAGPSARRSAMARRVGSASAVRTDP